VETRGLVLSASEPPALAFVHIDDTKNRTFEFYRNHTADLALCEEDLDLDLLRSTHFLHLGSLSLTGEPARHATYTALLHAKQNGALISYAPNYRAALWNSEQEALESMRSVLASADLVKASEEELFLLTGEADLRRGAHMLLDKGAALVLVTCGARGAYYATERFDGFAPAWPVCCVDTTGAGDAFVGAVLYGLRGKTRAQIVSMSPREGESLVSFANAAAALSTTRYGGIPAMPDLAEVFALFGHKSV
jgi:fructokinase